MGATKARTDQRKLFAKAYEEALLHLHSSNPNPFSNGLNHQQLLIIGKARKQLQYSEKTNNIDIWRFLINALK